MSTGKQNLFTFGCSFTFGHGFPDCNDLSIHRSPSKYAWPSLLAKKLDLPLHNLASPGCSPFELGRRFLKHKHKISANDIVLIVWPYFDRTCVIVNSSIEGVVKFSPGFGVIDPGHEDLLPMDVEYWFKHYTNSQHQLEEFMFACKMIDTECKQLGVNVLHSVFLDEYKQLVNHNIKDPEYSWFDVKLERNVFDFIQRKKPYLEKYFNTNFYDLPDGHRGSNHHKFWTESVYRKIVRRGWLNNT